MLFLYAIHLTLADSLSPNVARLSTRPLKVAGTCPARQASRRRVIRLRSVYLGHGNEDILDFVELLFLSSAAGGGTKKFVLGLYRDPSPVSLATSSRKHQIKVLGHIYFSYALPRSPD
jgi:hypothetical protein